MKFIYLLFVFLIASNKILSSDIIYQQDFESQTLDSQIKIVNYDGVIPQIDIFNNSRDAWVVSMDDFDKNNRVASSTSYFSTDRSADRWLILPKIKMGDNSKLIFKARNYSNGHKLINLEVLVSNSGYKASDLTHDFISIHSKTPLDLNDVSRDNWEIIELDISDYDSEEIHIAFRATGKDGYLLQIDDIEIYSKFKYNIKIESIDIPKYLYTETPFRPKFTVKNYGEKVDIFAESIIEFYRENSSTSEITFFLALPLQLKQDDTVSQTSPLLKLLGTGIYRVKVTLLFPQNPEISSQFYEQYLVLLDKSASKNVLVERFTSTECGECPKFEYIVDSLSNHYQNYESVSIHKDDLLTNKYGVELSNMFPANAGSLMIDRFSLNFNREFAIRDYNEIANYLSQRIEAPNPVLLDATVRFGSMLGELLFEVNAEFNTSVIGNYQIGYILYISNIDANQDYAQSNSANNNSRFPFLYGRGDVINDYQHRNVMIQTSTNFPSQPVNNLKIYRVGESIKFTDVLRLPEAVLQNNPENLKIAFFIADMEQDREYYEILNSKIVKYEDFLSVANLTNQNSINVFPNPANDYLFLEVNPSTISINEFIVVDVLGNKVACPTEMGDNYIKFDVRKLAKGIYNINSTTHSKVFIKY